MKKFGDFDLLLHERLPYHQVLFARTLYEFYFSRVYYTRLIYVEYGINWSHSGSVVQIKFYAFDENVSNRHPYVSKKVENPQKLGISLE